MLECVVNISEGTDDEVIGKLRDACGDDLLDLHRDPHHNRSVFTLLGESAPRRLAAAAVASLDLNVHTGVHPRLGVVDVVPFVSLDGAPDDAARARDAFATWAAEALALPCFTYGTHRSLPEVRTHAFGDLLPDTGPHRPHLTAGACAVGARDVLVAYNVWLPGSCLDTARDVAREIRQPGLRALGLAVGKRVQVSMNLTEPTRVGPADAFDLVSKLAAQHGCDVEGAELVGLIPQEVLNATERGRWEELDLAEECTIEWRIAHRSQD